MDIDNPYDWDADRIREEFDRHTMMTIARLAEMTGKTKAKIKSILLEEDD